jgi:hypothetical protein
MSAESARPSSPDPTAPNESTSGTELADERRRAREARVAEAQARILENHAETFRKLSE